MLTPSTDPLRCAPFTGPRPVHRAPHAMCKPSCRWPWQTGLPTPGATPHALPWPIDSPARRASAVRRGRMRGARARPAQRPEQHRDVRASSGQGAHSLAAAAGRDECAIGSLGKAKGPQWDRCLHAACQFTH
jgi:hypothetical protein